MLVFGKARRRVSPALRQQSTPSEKRVARELVEARRKVERWIERNQTALMEAIAHRPWTTVADMLPDEPWYEFQEFLQGELTAEAIDAGHRAVDGPVRKAVTPLLGYRFDATRPEASQWAAREAGSIVTEITRDQRTVIRDLVARGQVDGITVDQTARTIRQSVGLTTQQAGWVDNYYERSLADGIGSGLSSAQAAARANAATARYHDQIHRYRSETIARTEIARAASEGRQLAWNQGIEQGFISPNAQKEWIAEADACEICADRNGTKQPIKKPWPGGEPPAHPNCRCDLLLIPEPIGEVGQVGPDFMDLDGVVYNLPIDDILFGLLRDRVSLPRVPGWGHRQPMPEVRRLPDFPEPGDKLPFDDIIDNAAQIIEDMNARAQAMVDAGVQDSSVGEGMLYEIYKKMGYDGKPMVVDEDVFQEMAEGRTIYYRGMTGGVRGQTAEDYLEMLRSGDYYAGYGTFGNGTYCSSGVSTGLSFGGQQAGNVMRILLSPSAKVIDWDDLQREYKEWHDMYGRGGDLYDFDAATLMGNMGRFAAARGYDAFSVPDKYIGGDQVYMVILNRRVMVVPRVNGLGPGVIDRVDLETAYFQAAMDDPTIRDQFPHPYSYARSRGFTAVLTNGRLDDLTVFD